MKSVAIIGAGQLGSRHLQSIAKSSIDIDIEVVEPFKSSRETAKARYEEIDDNKNIKSISFFDSIEKLSNDLDLVIVATGADVRSHVVTELLTTKNVTNIVLEKVLFQTVQEYVDIEELLKKHDVNCWVNHPRRMFPFYKELKARLKGARQVSYSFQGGAWGLGCNALHFIDHLAYLVDSTKLKVNNELLDDKIYDSKREGFIEFNGLLTGKIDNHTFSLYSHVESLPSVHTIFSDVLVAILDESQGKVRISEKKNSWAWEDIDIKIVHFQSELSSIFLEDILIKGQCDLPTYKEAMDLHLPFIKSLLSQMHKVSGKEYNLCPIT